MRVVNDVESREGLKKGKWLSAKSSSFQTLTTAVEYRQTGSNSLTR